MDTLYDIPKQAIRPMKPITILLADDARLVSETWWLMLSNHPEFNVVGSATSGQEALHMVTDLHPEIVLLDINMYPANGFEATRAIRKFSRDSKVIAMSMHALPSFAKKIFQLGACGYITKNSPAEELVNAIWEVNSGKKFVCSEVVDILLEQELNHDTNSPDKLLSKRETEVAQKLKLGLSSKEIGRALGISTKTVDVHRYNMLKKLELKNVAALVNYLNENGL